MAKKSTSSKLDWIIRIVGSLFLIPIVIFIYCYFFGKIPETIGTTYAGALTLTGEDAPLEDATVILEANLYTNEQQNGEVLFELLFTTYKGLDTENIYGKGIQSYGDPHYEVLKSAVEHSNGWSIFCTQKDYFYAMQMSNLYYYDLAIEDERTVALSSPSPLSVEDGLVIDIGGTLAMLKFKADTAQESNFWKDSDILHMHIDSYYYIDPAYFFLTMFNTASSMDEGTHYATIDLGDFFSVYLQNDDGQFDQLTATQEFNFVTCKINVHSEGVTSAKQSLFGDIASSSADIEPDIPSNFWNVENNYNITIDDCDIVGGYLILKQDIIKLLSQHDRIRCNITIDITNKRYVQGIATYGFYGIKINQIYIKNDAEQRQFSIMQNALYDTEIRKLLYDDTISLYELDNLECDVEVVS